MEELEKILQREDLFTQGYKPKQKVEMSGELFSKILGTVGEQQREIGHLKKALEAMQVFTESMEKTNSEIALEILQLHARNIDKKVTHEIN
jgi:K+/H+ antiporter YhaU regulatory subunit KhtT